MGILHLVKICMFVKNSFEYDARVTKEAKSLISAGHDVTVGDRRESVTDCICEFF